MRFPSLPFCLARIASLLGIAALVSAPALAQGKYDSGANDVEIKIGNTSPYSGPSSAYSVVAKVEAAYFQMLNERGGINGRKIKFVSYDDAGSPPKTVEQTRKLVESAHSAEDDRLHRRT